ncbi:ankyrin repeat domain-containing protein 46-like [Lingula anatina]|uniref:Ankyrin repeat domain-containing protein 46-like n=1 Tax=Lingula anatina TaxID=7574 RepID=A0A1S3K0J9_LINAN|nr:ankyrin repeat domain-containing protein 46-like [Lingula anatina]|eukprot:XP_013416158.1 ankyrin repeat domain-containing protein 46-like [Lingula anatina]
MSKPEWDCLFSRCGNADIAKELIKSGCDINERDVSGRTALQIATTRGQTESVQVLLENGADVNASDRAGNTPLHHCGHAETLKLLVRYGGDLKKGNHNGLSPLEMAKRRGVSTDVLQLFIELQNDTKPTKRTLSKTDLKQKFSTTNKGSIFSEFFIDVNFGAILCIVIIVVVLSLGVSWVLTGMSLESKMKIPIDSYEQVQHIEL